MSHLSHFLSHLSHLLKNSQIGRLCVCLTCLTCLTCLNPPPLSSVRLPPPSAGCGLPKTCKIGPQLGEPVSKRSWANQYQKRGWGNQYQAPAGWVNPSPSRWVSKKLNKKGPLPLLASFGVGWQRQKKLAKSSHFFFDAGIEAACRAAQSAAAPALFGGVLGGRHFHSGPSMPLVQRPPLSQWPLPCHLYSGPCHATCTVAATFTVAPPQHTTRHPSARRCHLPQDRGQGAIKNTHAKITQNHAHQANVMQNQAKSCHAKPCEKPCKTNSRPYIHVHPAVIAFFQRKTVQKAPDHLHRSGALSVEGVFQMAYILPERLLALVRPAFDLVLRRIRSLKRCVQACGCKIETPRYACNLAPGCISSEPTFAGLRKNKKKENKGSQKKGSPKKREKGFPLAKLDIA